jgi:hypothetical protein
MVNVSLEECNYFLPYFKVPNQHFSEGNLGNNKGKISKTVYLYTSTHIQKKGPSMRKRKAFLSAIATVCCALFGTPIFSRLSY